jgi:hypothetical protein
LLISDAADMPTGKRGTYRLVTVNLNDHEAAEADRLTDVLKRAGWPKANRSLIMREALLLLEQDIAGKDDEGVFRYFVERYARRLGPSRSPQPATHANRPKATAAADDRAPRDLLDLSERNH